MTTPTLCLLNQAFWDDFYGPEERRRIESLSRAPLRFHAWESLREASEELTRTEVIFSGWGMPLCDPGFLAAAPRLKAIFYAAGSVRGFVTDALWERGIVVSSANRVLAVPVAEFTLGHILLGLKMAWRHAVDMRMQRRPVQNAFPGLYGSVVGLVSFGTVARHLLSLLRAFRLHVVVHDPFLSKEDAAAFGVTPVSLEELFEVSHAVSVHTPWLPETEGMIRGHHLERMPKNASFINTARGAVVNQPEMIEALRRRPDLQAFLDVTHPEPPPAESALYELPNVFLTPHIAGPQHHECRRLGEMAVDEFERYLKGEPLIGQVERGMLGRIA